MTDDFHSNDLPREIEVIISAKSIYDLFPQNKRRAKNIYHSLIRIIHPDMNHNAPEAIEATKKLNLMWARYEDSMCESKRTTSDMNPGTDRSKHNTITMSEIIRNNDVALFIKDKRKLLLVQRRINAEISRPNQDKINLLNDLYCGSPISFLFPINDSIIGIPQKDGIHDAIEIDISAIPQDSYCFLLSNMKKHISGYTLEAEDTAWILKRLLFLCGVLETGDIDFKKESNSWESMILYPDQHYLVVFNFNAIDFDKRHDAQSIKNLRDELLSPIIEVIGNDLKSQRIKEFIQGVLIDPYTSIGDILIEYDDMLDVTFGGRRFHHMQYVK